MKSTLLFLQNCICESKAQIKSVIRETQRRMERRAGSWAKVGEIKVSLNSVQHSWREIPVATER